MSHSTSSSACPDQLGATFPPTSSRRGCERSAWQRSTSPARWQWGREQGEGNPWHSSTSPYPLRDGQRGGVGGRVKIMLPLPALVSPLSKERSHCYLWASTLYRIRIDFNGGFMDSA
eukprot:663788-Hanusia_phi.AAC.2